MIDPEYNPRVVLEEISGDLEQIRKIIGIVKGKIKYLKKANIEVEDILFQIRYLSSLLRNLEIEIEVEIETEKEEIDYSEESSLFPYFT